MGSLYLITGFPGVGKSTLMTNIANLLETEPGLIPIPSLETEIPVEIIYRNTEHSKSPFGIILGEKGAPFPWLDTVSISQRWHDQEVALALKDIFNQEFRIILAESVRFASSDLLALIQLICAEYVSKRIIFWLSAPSVRIVQQLGSRTAKTYSMLNPFSRSHILQQIKEFNLKSIMIPDGWHSKKIRLDGNMEKVIDQILLEITEIE
ncbi:MAG: hypothetical protein ACFFBD_07810 [Candidatus Hodarchaeota archaeon]